MPLYVFECPEHGEFEELLRMDETLEECPMCGKEVIPKMGVANSHYKCLGFSKPYQSRSD